MARSLLLHRRDGSYLVYLTNYISFLWRSMIFGLLSSAGFSSWWTKKGSEGQSTQPPMESRRDDYLRLQFVDDQCLRTAMQGFLRRESFRKTRLTRRHPSSSYSVNDVITRKASHYLMGFTNLSITCKVYTSVPQGANSGRCTQRPYESSHACP